MVNFGQNFVCLIEQLVCRKHKLTEFLFIADITAIAKVYGKAVQRNGDTFMDIDKLSIDFTMKNARFKVKDNLNSQNVLGELFEIIL